MVENLPLFIQVGRTFLNFELKLMQKSFFSCCGVGENVNVFHYYMQNDKQVKLNSVLTVKSDKDLEKDNDDDDEEEEEEKIEIKNENENGNLNKDNNDNNDEIEINKDNKNEIVVYENNEDDSIKIIIENE